MSGSRNQNLKRRRHRMESRFCCPWLGRGIQSAGGSAGRAAWPGFPIFS